MSNLDQWCELWNSSDTPIFHKAELVPFIPQFQSRFLPDEDEKKWAVFIPLCGKAVEIKYFYELGYTVIGIFVLMYFNL